MAFTFTLPSEEKKKQQNKPAAQPVASPKPAVQKPGSFSFTLPSAKPKSEPAPAAKPANYGTKKPAKLPLGGAYTVVVGKPNEVSKSERSQDAIPSKSYSERDHIVPVSLGGLSTKENLRDQPYSLGGKIDQFFNKLAEKAGIKEPENKVFKALSSIGGREGKPLFKKPEQPSYDVEMDALKQYEKYQATGGKEGLSLPQARLKVITFKQEQEAKKKGETTSVFKNFLKELPKAVPQVARGLVTSIVKVPAETVVGLYRLNHQIGDMEKMVFKKVTGQKVPDKWNSYVDKPVEFTVNNPTLKKILNFGDAQADPNAPVNIKVNPLFSGNETFGEAVKKMGAAGTNLFATFYGGGELSSAKSLAGFAGKELSSLTSKELFAFAKTIAVEKVIPAFGIGTTLGTTEAIESNKSPKEVIKDGLQTGLSFALLDLALTPFAIRSKLKKNMNERLTNKTDPLISYKETKGLGVDAEGKPVLARTEIDGKTGEAIIHFDQKLKRNPGLFSTVMDREHGKIVESRMTKEHPAAGKTVLEKGLDDFAVTKGKTPEQIGKDISFELKRSKLTFTDAIEEYKSKPEVLKKKAPTVSALLEHQTNPELRVSTTSTADLARDSVSEITSKVKKIMEKEPDVPALEPAAKVNFDELKPTEKLRLIERHAQDLKVPGVSQLEAGKRQKGIAMEFAAIKRRLEGVPTQKELANAKAYLESNHIGKEVTVDGQKGIVQNTSFGKVGIKLEDGTVKYVPSSSVKSPKVTTAMAIEHLKREGAEQMAAKERIYGSWKESAAKRNEAIQSELQSHNGKLPESLKMKNESDLLELNETKAKADSEKLASRVYDRMRDELPENMRDEAWYTRLNMKKDAERAVSLIAKDKHKAMRIAMNLEDAPAGQTSTTINIALAEKARQEGNWELYSKLVKNRSLEQTRRGQEIVAEKGSITDNSPDRYVKELIKARLVQLGDRYLADVKDKVQRTTKAKRAMDIITSEARKAEKKIKPKLLDLEAAQKLIDSLSC